METFFKDEKIYAQCSNPRGAISLPVGELIVKTTEWEKSMVLTDVVDGYLLNEILNKYDNLVSIVFKSPEGSETIYRAY